MEISQKGLRKFIGTKQFYKMAFIIILPIIAQQLFVSIAGYVDSLMINSFSNEAYSGVSAANRLMFVFSFLFIGLASATSIFTSQFFGAGKKDKILESFNLAWISAAILGIVAFVVVEVWGDGIVDLYIQSDAGRNYGYRYLDAMKWGMVITSINMSVSTSFRATKETILPMIAGIIEILVNIFLNYILIFGHFGFEAMDALGAAIATVISRVVSLIILVLFAIFGKKSYFKKFYKFPKIDSNLIKGLLKKGSPMVLNELLWSVGIVLFAMFYTYKNDTWYNAYAYSQNISDLFFIFFAGLGNGTAIIVGAALGAGDFNRAIVDSNRLKGLAVMMGVVMGALMAILAPVMLTMFTSDTATLKVGVSVLRITAIFITLYAYNATCFFILRAGGDSLRAFLLDQGATYLVSLPLTIVLGVNAAKWGVSLPIIFLASHIADVIKFFVATAFVNAKHWVVNLTVKHGLINEIDQTSDGTTNEIVEDSVVTGIIEENEQFDKDIK